MRGLCGILLALLLVVMLTPQAEAAVTQSTSYTSAYRNADGDKQVTQDAFVPIGVYQQLALKSPQDMVIAGGSMYIADTGNRRILIVHIESGEVRSIGEETLRQPIGVAVDEQGRVYVADSGTACAYRFAPDGLLEQVFEKPTSPAYGARNPFLPQKVAPTSDGGVYLVVDGSVNGLVQMSADGQFLGFVSATSVHKSLYESLLSLLLTQEQQARLMSYTPDSYGNLMVGEDQYLYATLLGANKKLQRLNFRGTNVFENVLRLPAVSNVADIAMSRDGFIYLFDKQGYISEISPEGYFLYSFGGSVSQADRLGLFISPAGIGVDDEGRVYCLDRNKNTVVVFEPTAMHQRMRNALNSYRAGDYGTVIDSLSQELRLNNNSYYAHVYLGRTRMHLQQWEEAASLFYQAEDQSAYSEAFWMIRDKWLVEHAMWIVYAALLFIALLVIRRAKGKKMPAYNEYLCSRPLTGRFDNLSPFAVRRALFHPVDTVYEIRVGHMGGYVASTVLILLACAAMIFSQLGGGFLFAQRVEDYSIVLNMAYFLAVVALFVAGNYFITAIRDGKGSLRLIYCAVSYSLLPLIIILPVLTILCRGLTYNEGILVELAQLAAYAWCGVSIVIMLKEAHDYSVSQLLVSLVLTVVFMLVVVVFASLMYLLARQLWDFLRQLFLEVSLHV